MMQTFNDRALKEWAIVCDAMARGRQLVLIRKGGIREEDGVFRVDDPEFFLMPTYEHQNSELIQPERFAELGDIRQTPPNPGVVTIGSYAVVDTVRVCDDEQRLRLLSGEHVWNEKYLQMRLNFNPYDPLYVLILKVFRLPEPVEVRMKADYIGCKSWVTLEEPISTVGSLAALPDREFEERRAKLLDVLDGME